MPYFHATSRRLLPSILKLGLGALPTKRSTVDCDPGVYLAKDPNICVALEMDRLLTLLDQPVTEALMPTPREELNDWVVIVVDDARLNPALLIRDEGVPEEANCWRYDGVIDVTNAVIIGVEVLRKEWEKASSQALDFSP